MIDKDLMPTHWNAVGKEYQFMPCSTLPFTPHSSLKVTRVVTIYLHTHTNTTQCKQT